MTKWENSWTYHLRNDTRNQRHVTISKGYWKFEFNLELGMKSKSGSKLKCHKKLRQKNHTKMPFYRPEFKMPYLRLGEKLSAILQALKKMKGTPIIQREK